MKRILLPILLFSSATGWGQVSNEIFAVTGKHNRDFLWAQVKAIGNSIAPINTLPSNQLKTQAGTQPTTHYQGIAALAFDAKHNRLYFAPLFQEGNILFIDIDAKNNTKSNITEIAASVNAIDRQKDGEGSNITRMTMGAGKFGYALSNDAEHFYRFDTKTNKVETLGSLVDKEGNAVSVHEQISSWGGDIIADDREQLYLVSMYQHVFKINPATKEAAYVGRLAGLSNEFRVNGAAVCEDNSIMLSHATLSGLAARIPSIKDLTAKEEEMPSAVHASDLASRFVLKTSSAEVGKLPEIRNAPELISAYPNPVVANKLMLSFDKVAKGQYSIDMIDGGGAIAQRNSVQVTSQGQLVTINTNRMARGWYIVRVVDAGTKEVWSKKVVLQ